MKDEVLILNFTESWVNPIKAKRLRMLIIEQIMNFIIVYPVVAVLIGYYSNMYKDLFGGIIVLLTTIMMSTCTKKVNNKYVRFSLQIFLPVLCSGGIFLYFSNVAVKYIIMGYLVLSMIFYYVSISKKESKVKGFSYAICGEIVLGLTYIFANVINEHIMEVPIVIFALLLVFLSIYYISSSRIECFMEQEKQYTDNELSKVYNMNFLLSIVICASLLVVFIIAHFLLKATGINILMGKLLIIIANILLAVLNSIVGADYKMHSASQAKTQKIISKASAVNAQSGHVNDIFNIIIFCIFIAILLLFVISRLIGIYKNLSKLGGRNETSERVKGEEEKSEIKLNVLNTIGKFLHINKTNREKIRKEYYKFIKNNSKGKLKIENSDVPFEIDYKVSRILEKDIKNITKLYEKARYSKEEISDAQVKRIKALIKESAINKKNSFTL